MRKINLKCVGSVALTGLFCLGAQAGFASGDALKTQEQRLSYTLGADMGTTFRRQGINIDAALLKQGLQDGLSGATLKMSKVEMKKTITTFQSTLAKQQKAKMEALMSKNKEDGEAFLAKNAKEEGVKVLENNLQYKVLTDAEGSKPKATDTVTVHYEGRLLNGDVFDSSFKRGTPATFRLNQVIVGWRDALVHMPAGATWEIYIPSDLAYGKAGAPPMIGPNETLIFKVHLLSIKGDNA